jgi:hypothetical protein
MTLSTCVIFLPKLAYVTMVHTIDWGDLPQTIVPMEFIDPRVTVQGDLHGKVEQTHLVDLDFTDVAEYPHMVIH